MKEGFSTKAIALCAVMAALAALIMLTGGLIPVMTYCSPMLASLCLIPVLDAFGSGPSWAVWAVTGALSLLIGADKEAAFFWVFFGFYPIIRPFFNRIKSRPLRIALKACLFAALAAVMYGLTCFIFGIDEIVSSFSASTVINIAFLAGIVICLLLYDRALPGLIFVYEKRLKGRLGRGG